MQNIAGVQVHETKFRAALQNQSISSIMTIIQNLLRPDIPESERIFIFVKSSSSATPTATNNNTSTTTSAVTTPTVSVTTLQNT
jgi:hypothetical protein